MPIDGDVTRWLVAERGRMLQEASRRKRLEKLETMESKLAEYEQLLDSRKDRDFKVRRWLLVMLDR